MVEPLREPEYAKQLLGPLSRRLRLGAADQLRKHDIFGRVELRKQVMKLIDETEEVAPEPRASVVVKLGGFLTLQADRAFESPFEEPDCLQERRLARP